MPEKRYRPSTTYACEPLAGCVYCFTPLNRRQALRLSKRQHKAHIIELIALQPGGNHEQRLYYALDLPQAVAKATEITVHLRRQLIAAKLIGIRPASSSETNAFFAELAKYDGHVPAAELTRCRP